MTDTIVAEAQHLLGAESEECLHSDETIKGLLEFFTTTHQAGHLLYANESWAGLRNLATTTLALRGELQDALAEVTARSAERTLTGEE